MSYVIRNGEVLYIGTTKKCEKLYGILVEYHQYESDVELEVFNPDATEQDYCEQVLSGKIEYGM
jgi:hypothetical protein